MIDPRTGAIIYFYVYNHSTTWRKRGYPWTQCRYLYSADSKLSLAFNGFQGYSAPTEPRSLLQANRRAIWTLRMPKTNHLETMAYRSNRDQRPSDPLDSDSSVGKPQSLAEWPDGDFELGRHGPWGGMARSKVLSTQRFGRREAELKEGDAIKQKYARAGDDFIHALANLNRDLPNLFMITGRYRKVCSITSPSAPALSRRQGGRSMPSVEKAAESNTVLVRLIRSHPAIESRKLIKGQLIETPLA
ncbi:hypothetical protein PQX77_018128 [Marasmius sp. AFHP31]|nr:hypothetical protein PQX77_018128 [Marasmius sp. AFHP31]